MREKMCTVQQWIQLSLFIAEQLQGEVSIGEVSRWKIAIRENREKAPECRSVLTVAIAVGRLHNAATVTEAIHALSVVGATILVVDAVRAVLGLEEAGRLAHAGKALALGPTVSLLSFPWRFGAGA